MVTPIVRLEPRWGTRRQEVELDLDEERDEASDARDDERARAGRARRPAAGKVARSAPRDEATAATAAAPTKLTHYDVGRAMPPAEALHYADWMGRRGYSTRPETGPIARKAEAPAGDDVSDGSLASAFGFLEEGAAGQPLPDELAHQLSAELGVDISSARVHTDAAAHRAAAALGARAFTIGDAVFFAAGAYDPHSSDGLELIAHELAHVAQNLRGGASASPSSRKSESGPSSAAQRRVSRPDDAHEHQADDFARRFRARAAGDPATIVNEVRAKGTRSALPFADELERHFGTSFDFVETYTGEAARLAGQLLSAGAFALRNIVVLADPSPQRETLLHELTHVVQAGQQRAEGKLPIGTVKVGVRGSDLEREASAAPNAPTTHAPGDTIHRDEPTAPNLEDVLRAFTPTRTLQDTSSNKSTLRYGAERRGYIWPRIHRASAPFFASSFASAMSARFPGVTEQMLTSAASTVLQAHKIAKVVTAEGSATNEYVVYDHAESPAEVRQLTPTQEWHRYKHAVDTLQVTFKWPTVGPHFEALDSEDAAYITNENEKYREAMRIAVSRLERFSSTPGNWNNYYTEVVETGVFGDNRTTGDVFALIVEESAKAAVDKTFDNFAAGDPIFDVALYGLEGRNPPNSTEVHGDGTATFNNSNKQILVECKAVQTGPGEEELRQARDYKRIISQRAKAYKLNGQTVAKHDFNHVVYAIAGDEQSPIVHLWYQKLFRRNEGRPAIFNRSQASLIPCPNGVRPFRVRFNPEFEVELGTLDDDQTHYVVDNPPMGHPGIEFKQLDVTLDASKTRLQRGSVTLDVAAGDLTQTAVRKPLTPETGDVTASADNRLTGLTSGLQQILGHVAVDASIVDEGVRATFTIDPSDIPAIAGFQIDAATLTATCTATGQLSIDGAVGFHHRNGKMSGQIQLGWNGGWLFSGQLTVQADTIPNVSEFTCRVDYRDGGFVIGVDEISFQKQLGAVTLSGTGRDLSYDVNAGHFAGSAVLNADLGMFGQASASATIAQSRIASAEFSYDSPQFKYPANSASPTFTGTVGGTVTYRDGAFSGQLRGTAGLNIPALQSLMGEGGLGLQLNGAIDAEGRYSGSIATTSPINIGDHFQIPSISCAITPEGEVEGDFDLRVVNFRHLDNVQIGLHVDRNGVSLRSAAAAVTFGTDADRFWGSLSASYAAETGLAITGNLSVRIKEGMVAAGTLTYSSQTNEVDVSLTVEEITLLQHGPVNKTIFEFTRQIPLINAYGLGIYLDIGFDLGFSYRFDLRLQPTISLEGFSLETFEFERAAAEVELRGELVAALTATPRIGLGLFALSPSLLRGGGGVTIPIVGEARLVPTGTLAVSYTPDGGVSGEATLGMPLTFGITGSVVPYAEVSLLDGVWQHNWTGEALTEFEIMPPKELFNFQLDLGGDLSQQEPEIPDAPQAPSAASGPQLQQETPAPTTSASSTGGGRDTEVPASGPSGEVGGGGLPSEPVNLGGISSGLQGMQGYQTIASLMDRAGAAWEAISGFFGRVVGVFRDFLVSLGDAVQEIIDGFVANGLAYLPQLLRRMVGDDVWNIIEPIITALTSSAEALLGLFEGTPPTGVTDFFPWALRLAANAWGMAFDSIGSLVSALGTMFDRLGAAAVRLVTSMVNQGMVGVKRHHYYIWYLFGTSHFFVANQYKIHLLGVDIDYWDQGGVLNPASAVAIGLFEILERMGVPPVGSYFDPDIGEESRDRWA